MLPEAPVVALILVAVVANVLAGLLSAGEAALLQITRSAAGELVDDEPEIAPRLRRLLDNRSRSVASAAFARVVLEAFAGVSLTVAFAGVWDSWVAVLAAGAGASVVFAVAVVRVSPRAGAAAARVGAAAHLVGRHRGRGSCGAGRPKALGASRDSRWSRTGVARHGRAGRGFRGDRRRRARDAAVGV